MAGRSWLPTAHIKRDSTMLKELVRAAITHNISRTREVSHSRKVRIILCKRKKRMKILKNDRILNLIKM